MKHYKHKTTEEVFGYEDDYEVTDANLVLMTNTEFELFKNPPLTQAQTEEDFRNKRDNIFPLLAKYMEIDYPITDIQRVELMEYRQLLRDATIDWIMPTAPTWIG